MISLKLRQAGERANHKRVHRQYVAESLQIRRRRRKKVPVADRQPLLTPTTPNESWSAGSATLAEDTAQPVVNSEF
jgi:hypothetical protein